jgi:hydroxypyruvate isomerase
MPRLAANLSMLYAEYAFLDRFAVAARDGFRGVEFQFPYDVPASDIRTRLEAHGLTAALLNCPRGDAAQGERGLAALPGREAEFRRSFEQALAYADTIGAERLHVIAGRVLPGRSRETHRAAYVKNLAWAAAQLGARELLLTIEPISTREIPGFFLNRQDEAHAICRDVAQIVGRERVKVQMDFYHCQITEGDLATKLRRYAGGVGHIQIAGVPERHEPDSGEVHYPYLLALIDELGYRGWVAAEYCPRGATSAGLGWAKPWLGSE